MDIQTKSLITVDGVSVWATDQQAQTILTLAETRKGGFARIHGYVATSQRTIPEVYDATVTTRFSYEKLIERQANILTNMTVQDIREFVNDDPKLSVLSDEDLVKHFNDRKAMALKSIQKTIDGDRSDAYRQGHDRCYLNLADGVKVHYVTEKGNDGLMYPVLQDGHPVVASIMLHVLEIQRTVVKAGQYKPVNSGVPVLVGNCIERAMKRAGVRTVKALSLKPDNFECLKIDGNVIVPNDVQSLM